MDNCIFCKIAKGEIPSATIYEDEMVRMILDINPASKGHALILPKQHYANVYEIDEDWERMSVNERRKREDLDNKTERDFEKTSKKKSGIE